MQQLIISMALVFFAGTVLDTQAEELVREFSGSRTTETVEFQVKAPWLIDWRGKS